MDNDHVRSQPPYLGNSKSLSNLPKHSTIFLFFEFIEKLKTNWRKLLAFIPKEQNMRILLINNYEQ